MFSLCQSSFSHIFFSLFQLLLIAELFFSSIFFSPLLFFRGGSSNQNLRKGDSCKTLNFSRLISCPFSAAGYYSKKKKVWRFSCGKPKHNHPPTSDPQAHVKKQKLIDNQFEQVKNLSLPGLKPSDILQVMKKTQPADKPLLATKSTIYVAKQKVKEQSLQGLSPIVHLNKHLTFSNYTTCSKGNSGGNLKALFFIHSLSLELLSCYHTVLFLDFTYKKKKYNMPLLHIAGVSGNNKTFSAAFCFLAEENLE